MTKNAKNTTTVKVSKEVYGDLLAIAGEIQMRTRKKISASEVVEELVKLVEEVGK